MASDLQTFSLVLATVAAGLGGYLARILLLQRQLRERAARIERDSRRQGRGGSR